MKKTLSAAITVLALGLPVQLQAYTITVNNASFELPPVATFSNLGPPTGWTEGGVGGTGVWNINAAPLGFWTVLAPDGNQIAYLSDATDPNFSSTLSQVTGELVAPNRTYTLSGYAGHPTGFPTTYTVNLYAGALLVATTGPQSGPEGSFETFTVIFNSALNPLAVAQPLRIELVSAFAQTGFDALTFTAPDGGLTLLLLGMSLTGLGLMRRKKA